MTNLANKKKRIIICGYPKSGNTWITRLTAELIDCPVRGFWCEPNNNEIAIEGRDRNSEYVCYKAHHSFSQLASTFDEYGDGGEKVIYVVRDPRDVVISASNFFSINPEHPRLFSFASAFPFGGRLYNLFFSGQQKRIKVFLNGVMNGCTHGAWLKVPWDCHVEGYIGQNDVKCLVLKYEDALRDTVDVSKRILDFIGLSRSEDDLVKICENQSFDQKKEYYRKTGQYKKERFMKNGKTGQWIAHFDENMKKSIASKFGNTLIKLNYEW